MVQLPGPDSVGQLDTTPSRRVGVGSWDPSTISRAYEKLGKGFTDLGSDLSAVDDANTNLAVANADASFKVAKVNLDAETNNLTDTDQLQQQPPKYATALDQAAENIPEGPARQRFIMGHQPTLAQSTVAVDDRTFGIQKDQYLAHTMQNLDSLRSVGLMEPDEAKRTDIINNNVRPILQNAVKAGYMTAQQAQTIGANWTQDYAQSWLKMQSPQDQVKILGGATDPVAVAQSFAGKNEVADKAVLTDFFRKTGGQAIDPSQVAWCAAFADAVLGATGRKQAHTLRAADFLKYGTDTQSPSQGDVVVFLPQAKGSSGHVGFVVGIEGDRVRYIAGNDGNQVRESTLPLSQVAGFRVPPPAGTPISGLNEASPKARAVTADIGLPDQHMADPNPPGLLQPGNINLFNRPVAQNGDGSVSTVRSITTTEMIEDGKGGTRESTVLIPTISTDGTVMSNDDAIKAYKETGQNLGSFKDQASADAYAKKLHDQQAKNYAGGQKPNLTMAPRGIAAVIPPDKRFALLETAQRKVDADGRADKASVTGGIKDDIASIENTGQPVAGLTPERVASALGPEAAHTFQINRNYATKYYNQTYDWAELPSDQIAGRLANLKPAPGAEGYAQGMAYYMGAQKQAQALITARNTDPAGTVDKLPGVAPAAAAANLDQPETYAPLVKARMDAQTRIGIPEEYQSPITRDESKRLWRVVDEAPENEKADTLKDVVETVQKAYGANADAALGFMLREAHVAREMRAQAALALKKLASGNPLSRADAASLDAATRDAAASAAAANIAPAGEQRDDFGRPLPGAPAAGPAAAPAGPAPKPKPAPVPSDEHLNMLREQPALAAKFDKRYGEGAAARALKVFGIEAPPTPVTGGPKATGPSIPSRPTPRLPLSPTATQPATP